MSTTMSARKNKTHSSKTIADRRKFELDCGLGMLLIFIVYILENPNNGLALELHEYSEKRGKFAYWYYLMSAAVCLSKRQSTQN
jgi:hypothetical protein